MKFLCKTSDLLHALNLVNRAIGGQHALPILGNVLLEVEGKRCTISATDLELSIVTSFEADIENEGAITIPAKAFLNFAQYNTDDEILLETSEGTQLRCTSKRAKTIIAGEPAQEYPSIAPMERETVFSLETAPLLEALHLVTFASAKATLRPVLSGIYLRAEKGNLVFVATDSYRLSEYRMPAKAGGVDISCIIPTKVLEELAAVLGSKRGEAEKKPKENNEKKAEEKEKEGVEVALSSQQIEFRIGKTILLSRLIDGKFPDYQQIIPNNTSTTVSIDVQEFGTVVKRMHYFAKETNNNLTFTITRGGMHIVTPQTQAGRDESTLSIELTGEGNKIALSSSYLLDFLGHIENDGVQMFLTDSMHPAGFRIPTKENFLHLIMPLRIQEDAVPAEGKKKKETAPVS